ncbi:unnamed protein product [Caenorhabditis angaria]|uniref:DUF19 domain-containing protein n=1 Tax=Caenorhabditis angaria TaxID=860376 RepID=A0A9P1MV74_9PELO|nr:unnamed protein product [Caenorhabditis angaria]
MARCLDEIEKSKRESNFGIIQSTQEYIDKYWKRCENYYKCAENIKCTDFHAENLEFIFNCFEFVIDHQSFSHCTKNITIMRSCEFLKNQAKFEDQKTEGCGEQELQDFRNFNNDFAKILNCE